MQLENRADVFSLTPSLSVTMRLSDMDHESKGRIRLWAFSLFKRREDKGKAKYRQRYFLQNKTDHLL